MATTKVSAADTIRDIHDTASNAGSTRQQMNEALDKIVELCEEELPELTPEDDETEAEELDDED